MPDSGLVATQVGAVRRVVCASPDYLSRFGTPQSLEDLAAHRCVTFDGLDSAAAEKGLARLLRGEPGWREEAQALGASHLYWGHREAAAFPTSSRPWVAAGAPVAAGDWGALYKLD